MGGDDPGDAGKVASVNWAGLWIPLARLPASSRISCGELWQGCQREMSGAVDAAGTVARVTAGDLWMT